MVAGDRSCAAADKPVGKQVIDRAIVQNRRHRRHLLRSFSRAHRSNWLSNKCTSDH